MITRAAWLSLVVLAAGCNSAAIIGIDEDGDGVDDYDGATLRIVSPASGEFLPLEDSIDFQAELLDIDGEPLDYDEISWTSSADVDWSRTGASFTDDALGVGLHDLTAEVELPNGDRLAHTVGGVLVQSLYAGTYSGLFTSNVGWDGLLVPCSGAVLIVVDPYGEVLGGDASCVTSLQGFELELSYLFDLDNDDGTVTGIAAADIFGWFQIDFPAEGTLDPDGEGLDVAFTGDAFQGLTLAGDLRADRVSRDAGL